MIPGKLAVLGLLGEGMVGIWHAVQVWWWGGGVEATIGELGSSGPQLQQGILGMEEADLPCRPGDQHASYPIVLARSL